MKIPRIRFFVIGVVMILCAAGYRVHIVGKLSGYGRKGISATQVQFSVTNELDLMATKNPLSDAASAIVSNDLRFVAIAGNYAPSIPGINSQEKLLNTNEIRWVDGSDRFSTRTYYQAVQYATLYNQRIVEHLKAGRQKP